MIRTIPRSIPALLVLLSLSALVATGPSYIVPRFSIAGGPELYSYSTAYVLTGTIQPPEPIEPNSTSFRLAGGCWKIVTAPPVGACCLDSTCVVLTESQCVAASGVYQGLGRGCSPNPCLTIPTGACCIGYACSLMTEADCSVASGNYKGDGTSCTPNPCFCRGDANCDGQITYADINPFVLALTNPSSSCNFDNCDVNGDGVISYGDINPFVVLLNTHPPCP